MKRLLSVLFILLCASFAQAQTNCFPVERVIDGDTIEVLSHNEPVKVRLIGVNAPELDDSRPAVKQCAVASMEYLEKLLNNQCVTIATEYKNPHDKFGRFLGYVYLSNQKFVNLEIIKNGFAWALTKYEFSKKSEFLEAEYQSRKILAGLWKDEAFERLDGINENDVDQRMFDQGSGYLGNDANGASSPSVGTSGKSQPGKDVHVRSYTRKDGTVVRSHTRSAPGRKN